MVLYGGSIIMAAKWPQRYRLGIEVGTGFNFNLNFNLNFNMEWRLKLRQDIPHNSK
jgi:hypothetical protein